MKDIVGFEGKYAVTRDGRVWSYPRQILNPNSSSKFVKVGGYFLKPQKKGNGYVTVSPGSGKKEKGNNELKIHRLVAEAYIPNPEGKPFINHINCIRDDNRLENLEWCTQQENVDHALRLGRMKGLNGTKNGNSKLTEMDVYLIRAMCELSEMKSEIAKWFGIERYFVHRIKNRQNWAHI